MPLHHIIRNLFIHRSLWDTCTCAHFPKESEWPSIYRTISPPSGYPATCYPTYWKCTISLHYLVSSLMHQRWVTVMFISRGSWIPVPESKVIIHFWSHFSTYYITRMKRLLCPSLGPMHLDNYKSKPCISVMRWLEIKPSHHFSHNAPM